MTLPVPTKSQQDEVLGGTPSSPAKSESRIYEYSVVLSLRIEEFEYKCREKLRDKWEPLGGVCVSRVFGVVPYYYHAFKRTFRG